VRELFAPGGTWEEVSAQVAAELGVEAPLSRRGGHTREQVLDALGRFAREAGRLPTAQEARYPEQRPAWLPPEDAIRGVLGAASWKEAISGAAAALGLPDSSADTDLGWTLGEVRGAFGDFEAAFGRRPGEDDLGLARPAWMPARADVLKVTNSTDFAAARRVVDATAPASGRISWRRMVATARRLRAAHEARGAEPPDFSRPADEARQETDAAAAGGAAADEAGAGLARGAGRRGFAWTAQMNRIFRGRPMDATEADVQVGGCRYYGGVSAANLRAALAASPPWQVDERHREWAPSIAEFLKAAGRHPHVYFYGYRVEATRADERVVVEGFVARGLERAIALIEKLAACVDAEVEMERAVLLEVGPNAYQAVWLDEPPPGPVVWPEDAAEYWAAVFAGEEEA
jgi:hypothetical protein